MVFYLRSGQHYYLYIIVYRYNGAMNSQELAIAHVTVGLKRGIGSVVNNLAADQALDNHVAIYTRQGNTPTANLRQNGVGYHESPAIEAVALSYGHPDAIDFMSLGERLHEEIADYDVVYLHGGLPLCLGAYSLRGSQPGAIAYPHGSEEFVHVDNVNIWQQILEGAPYTPAHAVSLTSEEQSSNRRLMPRARQIVLANAVDTNFFKPADGQAATEPAIDYLCMRPLTRLKGIDLFIEALARMPEHSYRAAVVGVGPEATNISNMITNLDLPAKVYDYTEQPRDWLRRARCTVFPSRAEGFSIGMLEALAVGNIVVSSEVSGSDAVRKAGGIVVPTEDVDALAEALSYVHSLDPAEREAISGRATAYTRENYSLPTWLKAHRNFLVSARNGE
jgi:glycosyltransferase involved in cell wall biosynthesis